MPKKYYQRALLTKPPSSAPVVLSSSSIAPPSHSDSAKPSVNDLIRESRRLQHRREPQNTNTTTVGSLHPSLREVLNLPSPPPLPRTDARAAGPSRLRRIPGPPPPRSWLVDSIYADPEVETDSEGQEEARRQQTRRSTLPDGAFPSPRSLQHLVLKGMANNWDWHAKYDNSYLLALPTLLKETLVSYIAVYSEAAANPLRPLFLSGTTPEERDEVRRLDLSNGLGKWTTIKQLERDLLSTRTSTVLAASERAGRNHDHESRAPPDSWEADEEDDPPSPSLSPGTSLSTSPVIPRFKNLRHLSLAISPNHTKAASWLELLSLANGLGTLASLSLAYWPQPTYTPNAASTRVTAQTRGSHPPVVYGGSDIYTAFDNDWREAAGILRALSRALYCLKWLDLTGCGGWFAALKWVPPDDEPGSQHIGPEWNGGWRGLEYLCLGIGWIPIMPEAEQADQTPEPGTTWNVEHERKLYRYRKDVEEHARLRMTAREVVQHIRALRKAHGGKWIDIDLDEGEVP